MKKKITRSREKIVLPNGCWCSKPNVSPQNWIDKDASTKQDWFIQYRFYNPEVTDDQGRVKPHQEVFRAGNDIKDLVQRRLNCKALIGNELANLQKGYNPQEGKFIISAASSGTNEIAGTVFFIEACELARAKLKCSPKTKDDIKSVLGFIKRSAAALKSAEGIPYDKLMVKDIKRKHISLVLDNCRNVKEAMIKEDPKKGLKEWSPQQFNHYRAYLMMLFKKLVELDAIESNPVDENLEKESYESIPRRLPTDEEMKRILQHFTRDKYYLRFIHIFFHSSSREIEMVRLKTTDVNMEKEEFRVTVLKGKKKKKVPEWRPIKKVALQYWRELMDEAEPGQYLFGQRRCKHNHRFKEMAPGDTPATRDYLTTKWQREVKDFLKIDVDLYALKSKNLDETAAYLDITAAQKAAGHESKVVTMIYAQGERQREADRIRHVPNALGG